MIVWSKPDSLELKKHIKLLLKPNSHLNHSQFPKNIGAIKNRIFSLTKINQIKRDLIHQ